jgi:DNA-binding XRE family transcriptional regulator
MTPHEAAAILVARPDSIRASIRRGSLRARRFGGRWRVLRRSVAEAVARQPRWREVGAGAVFLAAYVTPNGSVITVWCSAETYHGGQRFSDGSVERFELSRDAALDHYRHASREGVTTGALPDCEEQPAGRRRPRTPACARRLRERAGLTVQAMAKACGVREQTLRGWERDGLSPFAMVRASQRAKAARYLAALACLERGQELLTPDGRLRCLLPGCGAALSRFNASGVCARHD